MSWAKARAEVADALHVARGPRRCKLQRLDWFLSRHPPHAPVFNFGDELNVDLAVALLGLQEHEELRWSQQERAAPTGARRRVLAIGSVLGFAMPGDVVIGAGFKVSIASMLAKRPDQVLVTTPRAFAANASRLLAVRGAHTCAHLRALHVPRCPLLLGDPGLAVPLIAPSFASLGVAPRARTWAAPRTLCVMPHERDAAIRAQAELLASQRDAALRGCHHGSPRRANGESDRSASSTGEGVLSGEETRGPRCANVTQVQLVLPGSRPRVPPNATAAALAGCDLVAASALHGIIVADALRVPAAWLGTPAAPSSSRDHRTKRLERSQPDFKYEDYFSAFAIEPWRLTTIEEALALLDDPRNRNSTLLRPRFTLDELKQFAIAFVRAFPYDQVCEWMDDV